MSQPIRFSSTMYTRYFWILDCKQYLISVLCFSKPDQCCPESWFQRTSLKFCKIGYSIFKRVFWISFRLIGTTAPLFMVIFARLVLPVIHVYIPRRKVYEKLNWQNKSKFFRCTSRYERRRTPGMRRPRSDTKRRL